MGITSESVMLESRLGNHSLDREGNFSEVEIPTNDFFPNDFNHLLADGSCFGDLLLISAYSTTLWIRKLMPMLFFVFKEPNSNHPYLYLLRSSCSSYFVGEINPS